MTAKSRQLRNRLAWQRGGLYPATGPPISLRRSALSRRRDGDVFYTPTNIQILARPATLDGSVTNVEFFAGATDLGRAPGRSRSARRQRRYRPRCFFNWLNPSPGNYPLTAVATDNSGTFHHFRSRSILPCCQARRQPIVRPSCSIIGPPNGATFLSPVDIPIYADANDPDGSCPRLNSLPTAKDLGPAIE